MKSFFDFKEEIHKCSKCGLCQAECPVYKVTGNDCTVSRGQFVMLNGVIKGDLKISEKINSYLDLCLKCGKCCTYMYSLDTYTTTDFKIMQFLYPSYRLWHQARFPVYRLG